MVSKSPSAFWIHSLVASFIENLSVGKNILDKVIAHCQTLTNFLWRANDQIQREMWPQLHAHFH